MQQHDDMATTRLPTPTHQPAVINGQTFSLLAFYYPGKNTAWDDIYNAPFLGNFWITPVMIKPGNLRAATFHTGEAAFQATKWWQDDAVLKMFENAKDGNEAFRIRNSAPGQTNHNWAGFGQIGAMEAVLRSKFTNPDLADALKSTGDAYLLEHNMFDDLDDFWSDNCDGSGRNELGLALMRLRDELNGQTSTLSYPAPGEFTQNVKGRAGCLHHKKT